MRLYLLRFFVKASNKYESFIYSDKQVLILMIRSITPEKELGKARENSLHLLAFILCGSIALPMLPIWQGGSHALAGIVLVVLLATTRSKWLAGASLLFLLLAVSGFWVKGLLADPSSHVILSVTNIYGHPLGVPSGVSLLLLDLICMVGLSYLLAKRFYRVNTFSFAFVIFSFAFWLCSLLAPVTALLAGGDSDKLAQMLVGSSQWATWCYMAILPMLLVANKNDFNLLLKSVSLGAILVCIVVIVQWLVGDYSYVLDAIDFENYFYRVRGTYYYHTPATFALALGCMFLFASLQGKDRRVIWTYLGILLFIVVISLNNTRGISLALMCGALVVLVGAIHIRKLLLVFVSLVLVLVMASNIFYVKPISGEILSVGSQESADSIDSTDSTDSTEGNNPNVDEVIAANGPRSLLFLSGLQYLPSVMWTGAGIGVLEIPLQGNAFNGLLSTYSTHTIYLDIALMAGIPAFIFFILIFSSSGIRSLGYVFSSNRDVFSIRFIGLQGALGVFLSAALFMPQERNNLIGIGFLIAGLLMINPQELKTTNPNSKGRLKLGSEAIIAAVIGWAILTSPSYFFPALEFVARYGGELEKTRARIIVTDALAKPVLSLFLKLAGVEKANIFVLDDAPRALPEGEAWVIWSPASDANYPKLRDAMGYQTLRQGGQAPSLFLPNNWWVVPSVQPVVMFLYTGARPMNGIPLALLEHYLCEPGSIEVIRSSNSVDFYTKDSLAQGEVTDWPKVKGLPFCIKAAINNDIIGHSLGEKNEVLFSSGVEIDHEDAAYTIETLPNYSRWADIQFKGNIRGAKSQLADLNYGSGVFWNADQAASFLFDMTESFNLRIGVYRMVAFNNRSFNLNAEYSWDVSGSNDKVHWDLLDKQYQENISKNGASPSTFLLPSRLKYRYYKFKFMPVKNDQKLYSGMMELELYPLPN
ncbi:MAG: hypothetical protein ACJASL_000610 [Paraglaciecola sp.]